MDPAISNAGDYDHVAKRTERVDAVVKQDVLLLKADVEGFEAGVLRGCAALLKSYRVENIFMEYSPGVAERGRDWDMYKANPAMQLE